MKVEFDFPIDYSAQTFNQTRWLVVGFADAFNFFQWCAGKDGEGTLVNDLVSRIEFGNDEMHSGSIREHAMSEGIFIRAKPRKRG